MSLLLSMSFSGSMALLVYFVIEIFLKDRMDYQCKRKLLICVGGCYLIPYQLWTWSVYHSLFFVYGKMNVVENKNLIYHFVQITPKGVYCEHMFLFWFMGLGIFTGSFLFLHSMLKYHRILRYYKNSEHINFVNTLSGKKRIEICKNKYVKTPFLIGIRKPIIVFPELSFGEKEYELIIEHELTHVYQRDNVIKIFICIIIFMNFYNPLVYIFLWKWECITEIACDEKVLKDKNEETRQRYAYLVIYMLEAEGDNNLTKVYFSKDKKIAEERIKNMKMKNRKRIKRIQTIALILLIFMASSLSTLAYSPKQVLLGDEKIDDIWEETEINTDDLNGGMVFIEGYWTMLTEQGKMEFFPDEEMDSKVKVICRHSYVKTTFNKHGKKSDGSCVVEVYNGKKCTKCGEIVFGEFVNSITYKKCPH